MQVKKASSNTGMYVTIAVVAVVVIAAVIYFMMGNSRSNNITGNGYITNMSGNVRGSGGFRGNGSRMMDLTGQSFVKSPLFNYAYLISGGSLSAEAKNAIAGFTVSTQTMSDGSQNITLNAISSQYQDQSYIVQSGQSLYFIERSMGDDQAPSVENALGDDFAVVVDANGYIVSQSPA